MVMVKTPTIKDTLTRASKLIKQRGLCKGVSFNSNGKICTTTAIQIACGIRNNNGSTRYPFIRSSLSYHAHKTHAQLIDTILNYPDTLEEDQQILTQVDIGAIQNWNDLEHRTQENVVEMLQLAATESEKQCEK